MTSSNGQVMANEPDTSFSGQTGGMQPPGLYVYPPGDGASTDEKPITKWIPYPYVPGESPKLDNPGDLNDK